MTDPAVRARLEDDWRQVDEGWGHQAVEFATLFEPENCREYVAVHQRLGVGAGDRLLDIACGAGLAVELAGLRGARCAGIDASPRLLAVARDRNPNADLHVGDMHALPWEDEVFDVVTSFRGIWGTTPGAVAEVRRVLAPGGRVGLTVWGHIKASPGAWALAPFALAAAPKVQNQAAMVALGRPGAGEALLRDAGFTDIERIDVPFVWEFADPAAYARAVASTGPAFEAIEAVGEASFLQAAVELARERVRDGLPLRAPIAVVGYIARRPPRPPRHAAGASRPAGATMGPGYLMGRATRADSLTPRQRAVLVTAAASTLGDPYCSAAWGKVLAESAGSDVAAAVIRGEDDGLDDAERALSQWARRMAADPNAIAADDVRVLRDAGFDDAQIFAITTFVALRIALSTINDALGASPDRQLGSSTPEPVRSAVTFGRPVGPDHE